MSAQSAHGVIAVRDLLPNPVSSSRALGWTGVELNIYRVGSFEFLAAHPEHLVSIQITGCEKMYQRRNGKETEGALFPGAVIVTPAGPPKLWRREGEGTVLVLGIAPDFLERKFAEATGRFGAPMELLDNFGTHDQQLVDVAKVLWSEVAGKDVGSRLYAEAAITQLTVHLIRHYSHSPRRLEATSGMPLHKLRQAKAYIDSNLGEDLSVDTIARTVGMSPFHFAHAFRASMGQPPHKYVMQRRMDEAKSLLRNSSLSITEIAQRIGYSSPSHFCVGFHKLTQVSPSDYRKAS
jgi:AraC family transcriptional regulator